VRAVVAKLKKSAGSKKAVKKAPAKKTPAKKAAKKAPVKKVSAEKKTPAKKVTAKKVTAKKVTAKKVAAKKSPGRPFPSRAAIAPTPAAVTAIAAVAEERRLVMPPPARPAKSGKKSPPLKPIKVAPTPVVVSENEAPWSASELKAIRAELAKELIRLREELASVEIEMDALIRESGEGAGDDQVDAGTKTFEREHEMSLVINARDMVLQTERALARIDDKTYGRCEECGNSIGKARLQVFPRATLCMVCKQKEERR
jgi:DnaK suppressor protein